MSAATDKAYEVMLGAFRCPERSHEREAWRTFLGELPSWAVEEVMGRCLDIWDKAPIVGDVRREVGKVLALAAGRESEAHAVRRAAIAAEQAACDVPPKPEILALNARWAAEDAMRNPDDDTPPDVVAERMAIIHQILDGTFAT